MGGGKKKIDMTKAREKKSDRNVAFSKRRQGLFKKEGQLHALTGAHVAILVFSSAGRPFTHGYPSFSSTVERYLRAVGGERNGRPAHVGDRGSEWWRTWLDHIRVDDLGDVGEIVSVRNGLTVLR